MLDAERVSAPEATPAPPPVVPDEQSPAAGLACAKCHAEMAPEQDWCLNCGAAAPGRLGEKAGWRAFSTIAILTALLVLGAAAASFAALSSDKRKPAVATAPAQVAQAAPPAAAPATTPPATPATPPASAKQGALPKVKAPSGATASASPVTPATPAATPKTTAPTTSAPRSTTTSPSTTPKTTTPKPTAPVAIKLDSSAGSTYDPSGRAAATGDAAKALDGDSSTSWYLDPAATDGPIGAGYAINLGEQRSVKRIELTTTTPGFRVEVYATDEATAPPEITDTRWSHITNVSKVGSGSGTQTIVVGGGTSKYQTVLLWITDRPSDGSRVRISELKVLG